MAVSSVPAVGVATGRAIAIQPVDPLLARIGALNPLTEDQARIVAAMQGPPVTVRPRTELGGGGDPGRSAYVLREGWAFAYTLLQSGERQVHGILLPGNVIGLGDLFRPGAGRGVEAITEAVVSSLSLDLLRRASHLWPEILEIFLRLQAQVQSALVDQLVNLGRRDSRARIAHLLLRLERRLTRIGRSGPDGYDCPLSQYLIADALGLTAIHVNRVLRSLREEGVVTVRRERVTIHDRARLIEIAGDDEGGARGADGIVTAAGRRVGSRLCA